MNVLCAQLSIPHLPLMNIAASRGHQICGHPFHWSIERSRSLRYRAGLGHTLQRTAVLRAVQCSITRSWESFPFAVRQRAVCP